MKILLVEDDRLLNHHLKSILQEESHQVYAAHQAEEALHFAEDYPIDVGIIDLGLPDMTGQELEGKVLVMSPFTLKESCWAPENQLWHL